MIAKMLLCASALMLGEVEAAEQKPVPKVEKKVEQKAPVALSKSPAKPEANTKDTKNKEYKKDEKVVDGVKLAAIEAHVVAYTNEERAKFGLPALEVDKELMGTAREHAEWMTRNESMVHTSQPVAENIAMGQPDSGEVVQAWMNSSGHRANILNPGHHRIGVAAFRTASGIIFWCQQFRD